MLIEAIMILFIASFVLVAAYGHVLVLQAMLAPAGEAPAREREFARQVVRRSA